MTTIALVAAKDAERWIAATVRALGRIVGIHEVWVVDDGSTDDTAALAHGAGATVVRLDANLGKGGALAAGIAATPHAARYLLADADLGATAAGLQPLLRVEADLVIGRLPSADGRGGFGFVRKMARLGIRLASGYDASAPLSGQRVVDGDLLRRLRMAPRFGVEVGVTIDAVRAGARVTEIPVEVDHDHTGRSLRGFAHRGGQGRDIASALLSRLTTERQRVAAVVLTAILVFGALSAISFSRSPATGAELPPADHVLLFGFDGLSLADLGRSDLPALRSLRRTGAAGALSVRTADRRSLHNRSGSERPSPFDAYASLGASARVRSVASLARARVGPSGVDPSVLDAARAQARHDHAASLPGALGDALHAAGLKTALVAGAELVDGSSSHAGFPGVGALATSAGRIDFVDASPALLEPALHAPLGLRASARAFVVATATALSRAEVVLVDTGDTNRATDANDRTLRALALRHTDDILGDLVAARRPSTTIIVFSPTPPGADWELTPIVVAGTGIAPGTIASASTRRASLGVLSDLAPTVLRLVGAAPTAHMTGTALRATPGEPRLAELRRFDIDGAVRSRFFLPAAVGYTVVVLAFYLLLIGTVRRGAGRRWRRVLRRGACIAAAFPLVVLVTGAMQHWLHRGGESPTLLVLLCTATGISVSRLKGLKPAYAIAAATLTIICIDVAATGPIHAASILGYSLQTTGRFYGLPNASTSVFAASLLIVAAAIVGTRPTRVRRVAGVGAICVGVAFVAAPWLGNDVGGTLALAPVGAAVGWCFLGRRLSWRVAVAGALVVGVAVAGYVLAEAALGAGHLGRAAVEGARDNATVTNTLAHRIDGNVGLLVAQWWGFLCIALALFGIDRLVRRRRDIAYLPLGSPLRIATIATLVTSLLGFVFNDSGPVVIVLCLVVLAPVLALLALDGSTPVASPRP